MLAFENSKSHIIAIHKIPKDKVERFQFGINSVSDSVIMLKSHILVFKSPKSG